MVSYFTQLSYMITIVKRYNVLINYLKTECRCEMHENYITTILQPDINFMRNLVVVDEITKMLDDCKH